jgi:hypothetical protein
VRVDLLARRADVAEERADSADPRAVRQPHDRQAASAPSSSRQFDEREHGEAAEQLHDAL